MEKTTRRVKMTDVNFLPAGSFTFMGGETERTFVRRAAQILRIKCGEAQGNPYVSSKQDYNDIVRYLRKNNLPGGWQYASAANF